MATALVLAEDGRRVDGRWRRGAISQNPDLSPDAWRVAMVNAGTVLDYAPDLAAAVVNGGHGGGPRRAGLLVVDDAGHKHRHPATLRRSDGFDSVLVEQHSESLLRHVQRERRHVGDLFGRQVVG
jgi:hypothetical protein